MPKKIAKELHPWAQESNELLKNLETTEKGLTENEVKKRFLKYGYNEIAKQNGKSALKILLGQLLNPLIIVLIIASILSFFLGESTDSVIIIAIVIINSFVGFFQEFRAEKTIQALRKLISRRAKVLRNGKEIETDAKFLVPGDIGDEVESC